jgi:hypothetical protein
MLLSQVKLIRNVLPLLILTTFLISSCSSVKQLEVFKTEVPRTKLNLPDPETPRIQDLNWIIITSENADEVFAKLKEQNIDPVLFGLTDDDYETLAVNFAQIRAYMIKQKLTLDQYREYYETEKTIADK